MLKDDEGLSLCGENQTHWHALALCTWTSNKKCDEVRILFNKHDIGWLSHHKFQTRESQEIYEETCNLRCRWETWHQGWKGVFLLNQVNNEDAITCLWLSHRRQSDKYILGRRNIPRSHVEWRLNFHWPWATLKGSLWWSRNQRSVCVERMFVCNKLLIRKNTNKDTKWTR